MRAELFTAIGGFVASFDLPPYKEPPPGLQWGDRTFNLAGECVHLSNCGIHTQMLTTPPQAGNCTCGGAYAYSETVVYVVMDMHRIEKGRENPITRKMP
jgi:hypothetical protein